MVCIAGRFIFVLERVLAAKIREMSMAASQLLRQVLALTNDFTGFANQEDVTLFASSSYLLTLNYKEHLH